MLGPRISTRLRPLLGAALLLTADAGAARARPEPSYEVFEARWSELETTYGMHGALVLEHTKETKILLNSFGKASTRTTERIRGIVFDVHRRSEWVDRTFYLRPGEKLKGVEAWGHEHGGKGEAWLESRDVHKEKMGAGWQRVRFAVPGVGPAGFFGIEITTEEGGIGAIVHRFSGDAPVRAGEFRFVLTLVDPQEQSEVTGLLNTLYHEVRRGSIQKLPPRVTSDGYTQVWKVQDLPPEHDGPLVPALKRGRVEVILGPRDLGMWAMAGGYQELLEKAFWPHDAAFAWIDTLRGRAPADILTALCRYLDDPGSFRVVGEWRSPLLAEPELAPLLTRREGTAFEKTLIAHAGLEALGIKSRLVLGASIYDNDIDWRIVDPLNLDAALLWIPQIGDRFLWDVAYPAVPPGYAGPDLGHELLVCDPDLSDPIQGFPVWDKGREETHRWQWTLDPEQGQLDGTLEVRIVGWPIALGVNPWDGDAAAAAGLEAFLPRGTTARNVRWAARDREHMRCSPESPAVLRVDVAAEPGPAGTSGWEVIPFPAPLPDFLTDVMNDPATPIFVSETITLIESVAISMDPSRASGPSAPITARTGSGAFNCEWKRTADGVLATRSLTLSPGVAETADDVAALCRAWVEAGSWRLAVQ